MTHSFELNSVLNTTIECSISNSVCWMSKDTMMMLMLIWHLSSHNDIDTVIQKSCSVIETSMVIHIIFVLTSSATATATTCWSSYTRDGNGILLLLFIIFLTLTDKT